MGPLAVLRGLFPYQADRDYAAAVNIASLGVAYLLQMKLTGQARACSIFEPQIKPVIYTATAEALCSPDSFGKTVLLSWLGRLGLPPIGTAQSSFLSVAQDRLG